jgi:hypothetical protein
MRPKEIIMKVIHRISLSKSILSSHPKKYKSDLPGEVILNLPENERIILKTLSYKDL